MAALSSSMNGLLYSLGLYLRDAYRGRVTSTAGNTVNSFTDANLALGTNNEETDRYVGSEIYFETTTGMGANVNPFRVTAYDPGTGRVTFTPAFGVATPAVSLEYILQNIQGQGWPHALKLETLTQVLRDLGVMTRAKVTVSTPDQVSYWNAIPAGIDSIYGVTAVDAAGRRTIIRPNMWNDWISFQDRTISLPYDSANGLTFQLYGRVKYTEPTDLAVAIPNINTNMVVKMAAERLMSPSGITQDRRVWQGLYESRMRGWRDTPLPNERFLVDYV